MEQDNKKRSIGPALGWLCAVSGLVGLISMVVYLIKKNGRAALQSIALPFLNWGIIWFMVETDNSLHWFPDMGAISYVVAGALVFVAIPLLSFRLVGGSFSGIKREGGSALAMIQIDALKDRDPSVRRKAAEILGNMSDESAFRPLEEASEHDPEPEVREAAKNAMGKLGGRLRADA